jgi:hypothetical protein
MRRSLIVVGILVMLYAIVGAVTELGGKIGGVLIFLGAVLVIHDAIWMPLMLLTGRFVKQRTAAIVAASLALTALPLALGRGRTADNPSALPLHYARNLALVLAAIVASAAIAKLALVRRKNSAIGERRKGR